MPLSVFTSCQSTIFRKRVEAQIKEIGGKLDKKKAEVRVGFPAMHIGLISSAIRPVACGYPGINTATQRTTYGTRSHSINSPISKLGTCLVPDLAFFATRVGSVTDKNRHYK